MYSSRFIITTVTLVLLLNNIHAELFPNKCKLDDTKCLLKATNDFIPVFAAGIPSLGIASQDPMYIKHIDASTGSLKFFMYNNTVTGLKSATVKSIKIDLAKSTMHLHYEFTNCRLESQYEISGRMLFFPIEGKGALHTLMRGIETHLDVILKETLGVDGKIHWTVEHKNHKYIFKDKSDVEFENLFEGNKILAAATKEIISQNGNAILYEVGGPGLDAVAHRVLKSLNEMLEKIPVDEMYIK